MRTIVVRLLVALLFVHSVCFGGPFYQDRYRGWHWYEKNVPEEEESRAEIDYSQQVSQIRMEAEKSLHRALIHPTEDNVMRYIKAQERIGAMSTEFSRAWQRAVYLHPELDRTLKYPVSSNALHIARRQESERKRQKIRDLSKEYGLMYFFRGDCKYCQGFTHVVKNFAASYNWTILPIQMGAVSMEGLENARLDNGISARFAIKAVPALIAVNPRTLDVLPLAFGYVSEEEIEDRIDVLTSEAGK